MSGLLGLSTIVATREQFHLTKADRHQLDPEIISNVNEKSRHWTCSELRGTTDEYYRQIPAFVTKMIPYDILTLN